MKKKRSGKVVRVVSSKRLGIALDDGSLPRIVAKKASPIKQRIIKPIRDNDAALFGDDLTIRLA